MINLSLVFVLPLHLRIYRPRPPRNPTATYLQSINHTLAMVPLVVMPSPPTRPSMPIANSVPQARRSLKREHAMIIPLPDCSDQISESTPRAIGGHRDPTGLIQSSNLKSTQSLAVDSKYVQIHRILEVLTARSRCQRGRSLHDTWLPIWNLRPAHRCEVIHVWGYVNFLKSEHSR